MQSLYHYITNPNNTKPLRDELDCHVHLFDDLGPLKSIPKAGGVGFADYSIIDVKKYKGGTMMAMYDKWTNTSLYNLTVPYNLLATSPDPMEAIEILQKYQLPGFGEIKCYDTFYGKEHEIKGLGMKNIEYWEQLFGYAQVYKKPVWIHWSLVTPQDIDDFEDILKSYPDAKFILCHCGVGTKEEYMPYWCTSIFRANPFDSLWVACEFAKKYDNCYLDISWTASELLINGCELGTPEALQAQIPLTKIVIGSDLNPNVCREHPKEAQHLRSNYKKMWEKFGKYVGANMLRIFDNINLRSNIL